MAKYSTVFPTPVGVFRRSCLWGKPVFVFPTPVGVFLAIVTIIRVCVSLPHARGGVSSGLTEVSSQVQSSPRPWGCFLLDLCWGQGLGVFPTPVGVFLNMEF